MQETSYKKNFPELYIGEVLTEPDENGKCKIRVASVHGSSYYPEDTLPWANPIIPSSIPSKGDRVYVFFLGGVKDFPVYIGNCGHIPEDTVDTDSAYELYKERHPYYTGTKEEWVASLSESEGEENNG